MIALDVNRIRVANLKHLGENLIELVELVLSKNLPHIALLCICVYCRSLLILGVQVH